MVVRFQTSYSEILNF